MMALTGSYLGFLIGTILVIFYLQKSHPDTSYQVIGLSVLEKKFKINFQDGGHLEFSIRKILTVFQSLQYCLTSLVNWPFSSGEEVQNRFS